MLDQLHREQLYIPLLPVMARACVCDVPSTHVLHALTKIVQPLEVVDLLAQRDAISGHVVMDGRPIVYYGAVPALGPYLPTGPARCVPSCQEVGSWVPRPLLRRLLLWNLTSRMLCPCALCALLPVAFCPDDLA